MFKKTLAALMIAAAGIMAPAAAHAITHAVVINATEAPLSVNGSTVQPLEGTWSALDSRITLPGGKSITISDLGGRCDGALSGLIQAAGSTLPKITCVKVRFLGTGCVLAAVRKSNIIPDFYDVELVQTTRSVCRDRWWSDGGKDLIFGAADRLLKYQGNAAQILSAVAP